MRRSFVLKRLESGAVFRKTALQHEHVSFVEYRNGRATKRAAQPGPLANHAFLCGLDPGLTLPSVRRCRWRVVKLPRPSSKRTFTAVTTRPCFSRQAQAARTSSRVTPGRPPCGFFISFIGDLEGPAKARLQAYSHRWLIPAEIWGGSFVMKICCTRISSKRTSLRCCSLSESFPRIRSAQLCGVV